MANSNLYVKKQGITVNLPRMQYNYYLGEYYDGYNDDPIDGLQWTGSTETLIDCSGFNQLQKIAPKIKFDYGEWSGFPNFQYVFIATNSSHYNVYALTNNNTILQRVGDLFLSYSSSTGFISGGTVTSYTDPDENYVPENTNIVETITVNNKVYTYYGFGTYLQNVWQNAQDGTWVITDSRNPYVNNSCYGPTWSNNITAVTYYDGITLPEWYTETIQTL